jgi:predicted nucleic acid-binding protein
MYLDTSALVPLYVAEPESDRCEAIASRGDGFFSSELLLGEMTGALLAKEKARLLTPAQRARIQDKFDEHLADGTLRLITLNGLMVKEAVEVMQHVHPQVSLRTLDAIHLATYLSVDAGPLFTRDKRMIEAARKLNILLADD